MRTVGASRIVITSQHRSWSGDIHSQTRQIVARPQGDKQQVLPPSARAAVPPLKSMLPPHAEDDWSDRASVPTLPTLPRHTAPAPIPVRPRLPPILYADILKSDAPASPPRPSSRAVVWPLKRPASVSLTPSPPLRHRKAAPRPRPQPQVKSHPPPIVHPREDGRPAPLPHPHSCWEVRPRGRQSRADTVLPVVEEVLEVTEPVATERQRLALRHSRKRGRHSSDSAALGPSRVSTTKVVPARGDGPRGRPGALSRGVRPPGGGR
ncbi:hypothetical protein C8Q80DRAFT_476024 [Daedaleopsis nitida]|nr:hypothetical protein C8Q80DRAFT_476024 [Daedaleopsis nitida]